MKHILITILTIILSISSYCQEELIGFLKGDKNIILDTVSYNAFWEIYERKVLIKCVLDNTPLLLITLSNYETDSAYILGEAFVENLKNNVKIRFIWRPTGGTYYISKIDYFGEHDNPLKGYVNYRDESLNTFTDYLKQPELEKEYFQGEYRLDLSTIKTFPEYFKELYEEKYGPIKEP